METVLNVVQHLQHVVVTGVARVGTAAAATSAVESTRRVAENFAAKEVFTAAATLLVTAAKLVPNFLFVVRNSLFCLVYIRSEVSWAK